MAAFALGPSSFETFPGIHLGRSPRLRGGGQPEGRHYSCRVSSGGSVVLVDGCRVRRFGRTVEKGLLQGRPSCAPHTLDPRPRGWFSRPDRSRRQRVSTSGNTGPLGRPRGVGFGILMFIVALHFYSWYWVFKTQEEMRQHTGEGLGGVLGLVVWIVINPVEAFVIPSEVGKMYAKNGQEPPVTGWTGLWLFPFGILIIPAIVWFVKVQEALNRYWA